MKKIRIYIFGMVAFLWLYAGTQARADFSGFVQQLLTMNIPIHSILSHTGINRYELTRLLNAVECKDCIVPDTTYTNKYTNLFWQKFTDEPGRDFDDILYKQANYNKKSYYYCVAYVGDRTYMRWYPLETSPICAGEFCGTRYTTKAEFLQVIMNMIAKYLYPIYSLNWNVVQERVDDLNSRSYAYKNLSEDDLSTIKKRSKECGKQICSLQDANELNIYLKYCMFNLKECGMIPFEKIKEGYRPVAELNVLYRQQMISLDDAVKYNIGTLIDWRLAVEILSRINWLIWCSFNNDYDCDGIDNSQDSCPTTYSPQQKDYDKDGIGDVCDDDIDNDWIKNPIGIVDDNWNINIALWTWNMDNCLFVVNKDQTDNNGTYIGDACEELSPKLSLSIAIQKTEWVLPKTVTFWALSKWPVTDIKRDFGDWTVGSGINISHSYLVPGLYTIRLFAKGKWTNDAYAKTTLIVWRDPNEKQWLYTLNTSLLTKIWWEGNFSLSALGTHDSYERKIWDTTITTENPILKKKFPTAGTYPISVKAIRKWEIVAATLFSFGVWDGAYASMLSPSTLLPEKYTEVSFTTKLANFFPSSISRIVRDFGDWEIIENTETTTKHSYQSVGKKIVIQTIFLRNWTKLQNMVTLFVGSTNLFSSYAIQLLPSSLELSTFQPFTFKITPSGDSFSDLIFANIIAGDATSTVFPLKNRIVFPLQNKHIYKNPWIYYPQTNLALDQCTQLSAQATLAVGWQDFCLQAKLNWELLEFVCDMDKDTIPDICDADIDGDGIPNLLWTINPTTTKNCNYLANIENDTNKESLVNSDLLKIHFKWICTLDNAPYTPNTTQWDQNRNGIGDAMEDDFDKNDLQLLTPIIDTDGDGIADEDDVCPLIPESQNGISDYDWCPEIWLESYCDNNWSPVGGLWWWWWWWIPGGAGDLWGLGWSGWLERLDGLDWTVDGNIDWSIDGLGTIDWGIPWWWPNCGNGQQDEGETCLNCPQDVEDCLFVTTTPCLQCPCPFVDVDSNLTNDDIVKAVLRDKQKKYPWGYSLELWISY